MHGVEAARIAMRVNADARLPTALGISIALHVVVFIALLGVAHFSPSASPTGQDGNIVLQAMLTVDSGAQPAEPEPIAVVEQLSARTTAVAPPKAIPAPAKQGPSPAGNTESSIEQRPIAASGSPEPPVMITTRALHDLSKLPPSYAEVLAQRFTDPVQKLPELRVPLLVLYPREALTQQRDARIAAALAITENGEISERTIIPDDPEFVPVIVEALKEARFNPAEIDGRAVAYWAIIEFVFTVGQGTPPKGLN